MALKAGEGSSLKGVSRRISGRHAFIHERVLELVVRETELRGSVTFCKNDLAHRLGCCPRTLDRAIIRLRREGLMVTTPVFGETGAQLGNEYRATEAGIALAATFTPEKPTSKRGKAGDSSSGDQA